MDRHWLLTWTTYGTWLVGDARGFVGNAAGPTEVGIRVNTPGEPYRADIPRLRGFMRDQLVSDPVYLQPVHAPLLMSQFRETAQHRGWVLYAAAIMRNHVHIFVGVPGDPEPDTLLRDFKAYGSRRLNDTFGKRDKWWTQSGSKRKRVGERSILATIRYVRAQKFALQIYLGERSA